MVGRKEPGIHNVVRRIGYRLHYEKTIAIVDARLLGYQREIRALSLDRESRLSRRLKCGCNLSRFVD